MRSPLRAVTARTQQDRGAVIPLVALVLPVVILMTAFAVDLGRQRDLRRTMQARADMVSLDLVRDINGRTSCDLLDPAVSPDIEQALAASAARNDITRTEITGVVWGQSQDGSFVPHHEPGYFPSDCSLVPDAVRILTGDSIDYAFQPGSGEANREAVASTPAQACFSIGSFALSLQSGDNIVLNPIINQALGLSILSYNGLADFEFSFLDLATELGLGSTQELFRGDVSAADTLRAAATLISLDDPNAVELAILDAVLLDSQLDLGTVSLLEVIEVTSGGERAALESSINLLDLLATAVFIADGGQGLTIPTIELGFPGFDANGQLNLTQAPQQACGTVGAAARTSQLDLELASGTSTVEMGNYSRTQLNALVPGAGLGDLLCNLLGLGFLLCPNQAVQVDLTVALDLHLAQATGTSTRIACPESGDELDVAVASGLASVDLTIGVRIRAGSRVLLHETLHVSNGSPPSNSSVSFTVPPDELGQYKGSTPGSGDLSLSGLEIEGAGSLTELIAAISARVGLTDVIIEIVERLDARVVGPLSSAMGVRVSSADVAADSITCQGVRLTG